MKNRGEHRVQSRESRFFDQNAESRLPVRRSIVVWFFFLHSYLVLLGFVRWCRADYIRSGFACFDSFSRLLFGCQVEWLNDFFYSYLILIIFAQKRSGFIDSLSRSFIIFHFKSFQSSSGELSHLGSIKKPFFLHEASYWINLKIHSNYSEPELKILPLSYSIISITIDHRMKKVVNTMRWN